MAAGRAAPARLLKSRRVCAFLPRSKGRGSAAPASGCGSREWEANGAKPVGALLLVGRAELAAGAGDSRSGGVELCSVVRAALTSTKR